MPVLGAPVEGSLPIQWDIGATDCKASPQPPLQVHAYEPQTFILRESPCADPEANFLYLLIGSEKALLIDTVRIQGVEDLKNALDVNVRGLGADAEHPPGRR